MKVLGIDPGTRFVGYGIVQAESNSYLPEAYGVIDVHREKDFSVKLLRIREEIRRVVREFQPEAGAIESAFVRRNIQSALRIGEGRGCAILAMAIEKLPVSQYAPALVKKAVTGRGQASKHQVQNMVKTLLSIQDNDLSEDASDALAVAICHCHRLRF